MDVVTKPIMLDETGKRQAAALEELVSKVAFIKGDPGERGEQGIQGIPGKKGDKGEKGDKGDPGAVASVNQIAPDDRGDVYLSAADITLDNPMPSLRSDNVDDAINELAYELGDKIGKDDVNEMEITSSATAIADRESDNNLITPAGAQSLIDRLLPPMIHVSRTYMVPDAVTWTANTTSSTRGQFIVYNGQLYCCIADSPAGTWSQRKANYKSISFSGGESKYNTSTSYNLGDMCYKATNGSLYDNHMYVCIEDGTTGTWNASKWQDVGEVFTIDAGVDFRAYADAFEYGLARICNKDVICSQTQYDVATKSVAFKQLTKAGICEFVISYDDNWHVTKTAYVRTGYGEIRYGTCS